MPSATDTRTKRLLDLVVLLLDAKQPVSFAELREQFAEYRTSKPEAGLRAFERDKATLLELGVPIRWVTSEESGDLSSGPEGGYLIDRQKYRLPEVSLTTDEVAALVVTAAAARHQPEFPYRHAAELAVRKLMFDLAGLSGLKKGHHRGAEAAAASGDQAVPAMPTDVLVHMPSAYRSGSLADNLQQLEEAVRLRKRVTIRYDHHRSPDGTSGPPAGGQRLPKGLGPGPLEAPAGQAVVQRDTGDDRAAVPRSVPPAISERWYVGGAHDGPHQSTRDVDPYGLVYRQGAWLLVGFCHVAGAVRRFRVDRVLDLKVAPRPRTPDFEVPADFSLKEHGSFSPWRFEREEKLPVSLWISADTPWVAEEDFGPATRTAPALDTGSEGVLVAFQCGNPDYLVSRVLGAAGALRVLQPESLRRRIADASAAVARRNNGFEAA